MIFTHSEIEAHVVNFFRAYLAFAETGDNPLEFNTHDGLCIAKYRYVDNIERLDGCDRHGLMVGMDGCDRHDLMVGIREYMDDAFINADMCPDYPFGMRNYLQRYNTHTQHECPLRLQFIRNFLADKAP